MTPDEFMRFLNVYGWPGVAGLVAGAFYFRGRRAEPREDPVAAELRRMRDQHEKFEENMSAQLGALRERMVRVETKLEDKR